MHTHCIILLQCMLYKFCKYTPLCFKVIHLDLHFSYTVHTVPHSRICSKWIVYKKSLTYPKASRSLNYSCLKQLFKHQLYNTEYLLTVAIKCQQLHSSNVLSALWSCQPSHNSMLSHRSEMSPASLMWEDFLNSNHSVTGVYILLWPSGVRTHFRYDRQRGKVRVGLL